MVVGVQVGVVRGGGGGSSISSSGRREQHPRHELQHSDHDAMAFVLEQRRHAVDEVFHHVGAFRQTSAHGEACLLAQVGVGVAQVLVDFGRQVPRHVCRCQIANGTQRKAGDELLGVIQVVFQRVGG